MTNKFGGMLLAAWMLSCLGVLAGETISLNENWKFLLDDQPSYCKTEMEDADWRTLDVPHDWSVEFPLNPKLSGRNAWLPGGIAWYRKTFEVPAKFDGKHVIIQFDGVYKNASVWVNQHPVGIQHDGYTSFYFDISELVRFGEKNTIAVRVDNSIQPNSRWYSGSGIYRNVWLKISDPTHVANWGTYITTPKVTSAQADLSIVTTIENMDISKEVTLETTIYNPKGEEVARTSKPVKLAKFNQKDVSQRLSVAAPQLWSVDTPVLYTAISRIRSDDVVIDTYKSTFGIRTIEFHAKKGFFLNGKNMKLKGVCLHVDAGPLGVAVPDAVWERRLRQFKQIGCNAIRTAHHPTSPEFMDMCDQLGFLVMDEFTDKWEDPYKAPKAKKNPFYDMPFADPNFSLEWKRNFENTIRRDRNHPSVVIWSVGNENHAPGSPEQAHGLRKYISFVHEMDESRPVISGMERGFDKPVMEQVRGIITTCRYMDVIGVNYAEQWCKDIGKEEPGKPFVGTESYTYFNSEPENRFASIERSPWIDVIENDHNMGLFLWVGIDYLGESKTWPKLGSTSGLLDQAGFRKNRSYLYEAFWSDKPMVHIEVYEGDADDFSTSGRWSWPPMNQNWNLEAGSVVDMVTYTNCDSVDLYLNQQKIGSQKLVDFPNWIMKWRKIAYQKGTLRAVGIMNGKAVCETEIVTAGMPKRLELKSDVKTLRTGEVAHVEIDLVDAAGNPVMHQDTRIHFSLKGDAEIIALVNGNAYCEEAFKSIESRETHNGRCLCIIQADKTVTGGIELKVSSERVAPATIQFNGPDL